MEQQFFAKAEDPASWLLMAQNLKWCADKVCWLDDKHECIQDDRAQRAFTWPIYRMLLGLSFENLLKGLRVVKGENPLDGDKLKDSFKKHDTDNNIAQVERLGLCLSLDDGEREILRLLETFVVWVGRYPIPKVKSRYQFGSHGNIEHQREQALWARLNELLTGLVIDERDK